MTYLECPENQTILQVKKVLKCQWLSLQIVNSKHYRTVLIKQKGTIRSAFPKFGQRTIKQEFGALMVPKLI